MAINCAKCGCFINPEQASNPCPGCGSDDRKIIVRNSGHLLEIIKLKAKGKNGFKLFERKGGEKLSKDAQKARESLEIDHPDPEKTTKIHIVEEQAPDGSWELKHDERDISPAKHRPT